MKKFGKIMSGILAGLSMHGVAPSVPFLSSGNVACAAPSSSAYDKLQEILRKVSDQKGYDRDKGIEDSGDRVYIHCKNGNKVKVSNEDFASIRSYFKTSFRELLESYDYEKKAFAKDVRGGNSAPAAAGYLKVLRKFDNTRIDSIFPANTGWANKGLVTISNLAELMLSECEGCTSKKKEEGKARLSKALSNSEYSYYENNIKSYDFGALADAICDYAERLENWCEKLRQLKDEGVPLDKPIVNSGVLDNWSYNTGWGKGVFGRQWGYACVRNVVISVLNLFVG